MLRVRRSSKKTKIISLIVAALLLTGGVTGYIAYKNGFFGNEEDSTGINYDKATRDQEKAGEQTKKNSVANNEKPSGTSGSDTPPSLAPGSGRSFAQVIVTSSVQNGALYQIRALISALTTDGTCTLTMTQGVKTVTKTAGTQPQANTSTCKGFDIPTSELSAGSWNITLAVESPELTGTTSTVITIQ